LSLPLSFRWTKPRLGVPFGIPLNPDDCVMNLDMVSHMVKARATTEEVKRFLVVNSLEELNMNIDRYYMVLILRSLHLDFDHVHHHILVGDQIPLWMV